MKKKPPTAAGLIADLMKLVCGETNDSMKREAISVAYEIGKSEGRLEGAQSMGDRLVATVTKVTDRLVPR